MLTRDHAEHLGVDEMRCNKVGVGEEAFTQGR